MAWLDLFQYLADSPAAGNNCIIRAEGPYNGNQRHYITTDQDQVLIEVGCNDPALYYLAPGSPMAAQSPGGGMLYEPFIGNGMVQMTAAIEGFNPVLQGRLVRWRARIQGLYNTDRGMDNLEGVGVIEFDPDQGRDVRYQTWEPYYDWWGYDEADPNQWSPWFEQTVITTGDPDYYLGIGPGHNPDGGVGGGDGLFLEFQIWADDPPEPEPEISNNCECEGVDATRKTDSLLNLGRRLLIRMGYAANASNPPPGKLAEINDYLQQAQEFLYANVASFRQSRYFRWPLIPGVRFYGFDGNDDECPKYMQPELVEWVGVSDGPADRENWRQLNCGIAPEMYDGGDRASWPTRYEFRQCIEVWPVPDNRETGYLRIKARFSVERFTEPEDLTTIDSELVFMLALANMRSDYEKPGAEKYAKMVTQRIGEINAASHHTRRYHPSAGIPSRATDPVPRDGWLP